MKRQPQDLADDELVVAIAIAHARRLTDGRLGIREEIVLLEAEVDRRAEARREVERLERTWEAS